MNSTPKEYLIDKNHIFKDNFEEIKNLLEVNENIRLVTSPNYVPIAFQLAKELNEEGLAIYDEELKVERIIINKKCKTKIYLSLKRKQKSNEFLIENKYFYKNIFEQIKNYLKNHDKAKIFAKQGEVGIAFKVAKELVTKGIALYDEELQLSRNFKNGQGNTQVIISLKRKPVAQNIIIQKNSDDIHNIHVVNKSTKVNKKIEEKTEKVGENQIKIDKNEIIEEIHEKKKENNIAKDLDSKSKHKQYILDEKTPDKILKEIKEVFKENDIITFVAFKDKIGLAFKIAQILVKEGIARYDELKIDRNLNLGKGKTKILLSINKNIKNTN